MALILNIDTALDLASICLAKDGLMKAYAENETRKEQASWLHPAIKEIFTQCHIGLQELDAIAVSNGPGSYTGLRIGLSTAKGLCYALKVPLIAINTLQIMANAVSGRANNLICPMIDARRMEVYTAVFDKRLNFVHKPHAMVLDEHSFSDMLQHEILFTGSGSEKFRPIHGLGKATFLHHNFNAANMLNISEQLYIKKQFADLAYCEPYYLKPVHLNI